MSDRYQFIHLHHPGSLPGIPGLHSPGTYVIDWQERALHPSPSIEAFLSVPDPIAPETPPDGQETAQSEDAAITPPAPETPPVPAVDAVEADVSLPAQPEEGTNAPDSDAPSAPETRAGYFTLLGNNETGSTVVDGYLPIEPNAPDNVASPIAVGGTEEPNESPAPESGA